ncbi:MAG: neutral/alkaline non-lysosomal ceramidase N-terminal domain-containing protein [Verrucomicrobiales bacterium]
MKKLAKILLPLLMAAPLASGALKAGAAAVDITPPEGIPLAGYYVERGADGTLDPLFAHALVLENEGTRVALVTLDLISTTRTIVEEARNEIQTATGIPGPHVMISATHAHTGPVLAAGNLRDGSIVQGKELVQEFSAKLPGRIAQSVVHAAAKLVEARLFAGMGRETQLSFNRRFYMKDGTVAWNPGKNNPAIMRPAGPIDADVGVLLINNAAATSLAAYVNFAMHPDTTGGNKFSADYPGALARQLAGYRGPELVTLFANGCSGNLNHVDVTWADPQKGPREAHRIGTILAASVMQTCKKLRPVPDGPLRVRSEMVALDLPVIDESEVAAAREVVARKGTSQPPAFVEQVRAYRALDVAARNGKPHQVEVQIIALGPDLAWVGLPGEIFVELGLAIKEGSRFEHTMIAELANGSIGYIPNHKAYAEGAYEVISARCADGSGERLVDTAVRLLRELQR